MKIMVILKTLSEILLILIVVNTSLIARDFLYYSPSPDGAVSANEKPLKVYILAGQSNMVGHAAVSTFDYMEKYPVTAPILKEMRNADGTMRVFDDVWISSIGSAEKERYGKLTVGYGASNDLKIGPEYTFGIYMQKFVDEPILIIKTAWGGKSLHTDFRPPGAGPYEFNEFQLNLLKERGMDIEKVKADKIKDAGVNYCLMIGHVKSVLDDIQRVYPHYNPDQGYELAGFVWFQGWNDMVDSQVYPNRTNPGGYHMYSDLLAQFIRDVRQDLTAPQMPFVIGVMGVGGETTDHQKYFRQAMAAPAYLSEFRDNVHVVHTEKYWDPVLGELAERWGQVRNKSRSLNQDESLSPSRREEILDELKAELFTPEELELYHSGTSNFAFHYLGAAKIIARIGKAFAESLFGGKDK